MTGNNPNLDLVNINAHTKFGQNLSIRSQDMSLKEILNKILTSVKGHNSITKVRKIMCNNPNLDLVSINAYSKFGQILSICSQDIEWEGNYDAGMTHRMTDNQNPV